jgi:hypothetical protein
MAKYGLLDLPVAGPGRVHVRLSKPLLRLLVAETHLLEDLLFGRAQGTQPPVGFIPGEINLQDLLRTCRQYHADTQEVVQLVSLHISYLAWLLLRDRPMPFLRPGAMTFGSIKAFQDRMIAAAVEVDAAPARSAEALNHIPHLTMRSQPPAVSSQQPAASSQQPVASASSQAAFMPEGATGTDAWSFNGKYHFQGKGQEAGGAAGRSGGDSELQPAAVLKIFEKMSKVKTGDSAICELLSTKSPSPSLLGVTAKRGTRTEKEEKSKPVQKALIRLEALPINTAVVLLTRQCLKQAMGPIFGGIAARCSREDEDDEVGDEEDEVGDVDVENSDNVAKRVFMTVQR